VAFAREQLDFEPDPWQVEVLLSPAKPPAPQLLQAGREEHHHRESWRSTRRSSGPGSLVLLVSPSLRQSSELFKKVTGFLDALDDRPRLTEDNKLSFALENGSRVVSLPGTEAHDPRIQCARPRD